MSQQTFFTFDMPIRIDTRAAAAAAIERIRPSMLRQVFDFIDNRRDRGATDEEIAAGLNMKESTARARRVELRDGGQVRDSTRRRRSCSGRLCVVWVATGEPLD
jgi:hypothetical protein